MTEPVRILYIDDDAGLGVLLSRAFAGQGLIVEPVETGDEGLMLLASRHYDIVALDHNLVNEVGLDLIPRIRSLPQHPPIIYVTGSEDARIAVAALKAGAVDYVWKDVQGHYRELLRESIKTALAQEKLAREAEKAQQQIREAKDRAELLLHEVNHRVANSLALVSSFVQLQANTLSDPAAKSMLLETQARIIAIAGVHRRLYTSDDVRAVEVGVYLKSLVQELSTTMKVGERKNVRFTTPDEEIILHTDKVVALGVIVTELVTNAQKYAYADSSGGEIRVSALRSAPDTLRVTVEDEGIGWDGTGEIKGSGLGSRIIKAMIQNIQGELQYLPGEGTCAVVTLPI
jgi:two-component sensor histidine kinase